MVAAPSDGFHGSQWRSTCLLPTEEQKRDVGEQGRLGAGGAGYRVFKGLLGCPWMALSWSSRPGAHPFPGGLALRRRVCWGWRDGSTGT